MPATDFEFHIDDERILDGALLVVAFPTTGVAGIVAANFLAQSLSLKRVGSARGRLTPAGALVERGRARSPIGIHAGETTCGSRSTCIRLVLLTSSTPLADGSQSAFAIELVRWAKDKKASEIVVLDSFGTTEGPDRPALLALASDETGDELARKAGIDIFEDGVLHGLAGSIVSEAATVGVHAFALFTKARDDVPDARAGARIVEALDQLFVALDIKTEPLVEAAERIEAEIRARSNALAHSEAPTAMFG